MVSGAGGAVARRRRDLRSCFLLFSFLSVNLPKNPNLSSSGFIYSDRHLCTGAREQCFLISLNQTSPTNLSLKLISEETISKGDRATRKTAATLPHPLRTRLIPQSVKEEFNQATNINPSKSNLPSPCSATEWSYALTPEPVMILTAEGLDLHPTSSPQIVSYPYGPYSCGCTFIVPSSAKHLGFCLVLGLSYCCGPFVLPRPTSQFLSPTPNHKRPRCEFLPQTLRLNSPMARVDKIINWKTIDELLFLKPPSRAYLVSLCGNQFRLSQHVHKAIFLPAFIFINCNMKHLQTETTQKTQSRDVNPLFLLQTSRTSTNWSQPPAPPPPSPARRSMPSTMTPAHGAHVFFVVILEPSDESSTIKMVSFLTQTLENSRFAPNDQRSAPNNPLTATVSISDHEILISSSRCLRLGDILSIAKSFHDLSFRLIPRSDNMFDDLARTAVRSMTLGLSMSLYLYVLF